MRVWPRKAFHDDTFAKRFSSNDNSNETIKLELKDLPVAFPRRFVFHSLIFANLKPCIYFISLRRERSFSFWIFVFRDRVILEMSFRFCDIVTRLCSQNRLLDFSQISHVEQNVALEELGTHAEYSWEMRKCLKIWCDCWVGNTVEKRMKRQKQCNVWVDWQWSGNYWRETVSEREMIALFEVCQKRRAIQSTSIVRSQDTLMYLSLFHSSSSKSSRNVTSSSARRRVKTRSEKRAQVQRNDSRQAQVTAFSMERVREAR